MTEPETHLRSGFNDLPDKTADVVECEQRDKNIIGGVDENSQQDKVSISDDPESSLKMSTLIMEKKEASGFDVVGSFYRKEKESESVSRFIGPIDSSQPSQATGQEVTKSVQTLDNESSLLEPTGSELAIIIRVSESFQASDEIIDLKNEHKKGDAWEQFSPREKLEKMSVEHAKKYCF
jgi:hypothetical protein